jgi:hypothetical protein
MRARLRGRESVIFIHESDKISGELGGFHCSSTESTVDLNKGGDVEYSIEKGSVEKSDGVDGRRP